MGKKIGLAINPSTAMSALEPFLAQVDLVLIMTVNPGFGGQQFITHSIGKVKEMREMIRRTGKEILIEVDGGITLENAPALVEAGADVLVAGSTIFRSADPAKTIRSLKAIA